MYIEHLILPLPDNGELRKGAFRFWKVRRCMRVQLPVRYYVVLTASGEVLTLLHLMLQLHVILLIHLMCSLHLSVHV